VNDAKTPGRFQVVRAFVLHGAVQEKGTMLTLGDVPEIGELLALGKLEPADEATRKRVRSQPRAGWGVFADDRPRPSWVMPGRDQ
jgi:hypothetical protein